MVNTGELRARIQLEIQKHQDAVSQLQEKLELINQVELLSSKFNSNKGEPAVAQLVLAETVSEPAPVETPVVAPTPVEQDTAKLPADPQPGGVEKDASLSGNNPRAYMHQGLQAYLAGKPDKALELLRQARELNPEQFQRSWATMASIPTYGSLANDRYFRENLFPK